MCGIVGYFDKTAAEKQPLGEILLGDAECSGLPRSGFSRRGLVRTVTAQSAHRPGKARKQRTAASSERAK